MAAPFTLEDAVSGEKHEIGDQINLEAWDVRVFQVKS
jgi:hypothetical protein